MASLCITVIKKLQSWIFLEVTKICLEITILESSDISKLLNSTVCFDNKKDIFKF